MSDDEMGESSLLLEIGNLQATMNDLQTRLAFRENAHEGCQRQVVELQSRLQTAASRLDSGKKLVADLVAWILSDELIGEDEASFDAITARAEGVSKRPPCRDQIGRGAPTDPSATPLKPFSPNFSL
ncbi:MAG TPA: hypothetical protein VJA26_18650 [Gammaproteobacteria bacterium]|nr:hypothetical protein [Gammaproteobacteria bacterium]